jgi:hypothetical protein
LFSIVSIPWDALGPKNESIRKIQFDDHWVFSFFSRKNVLGVSSNGRNTQQDFFSWENTLIAWNCLCNERLVLRRQSPTPRREFVGPGDRCLCSYRLGRRVTRSLEQVCARLTPSQARHARIQCRVSFNSFPKSRRLVRLSRFAPPTLAVPDRQPPRLT